MPNIHYLIVEQDGDGNVTAFVPGLSDPLVAHSSHPNYDRIVAGLKIDDPDVVDLFDVSQTVAEHFDSLSERVSVANGHVYFDGDEVDTTVTQQILRFLEEEVDDWVSLVNFMENIAQNPNEHSREQLYDWLRDRDFAITGDGCFIGYKGVKRTENGYGSLTSGPAIVDGKPVNGTVPNNPGSIVELSRSKVHHDPANGCSSGLHVGTWDFAHSFGRGVVLKVKVNPRDVVSVPTDCNWQKLRCCRYQVLEAIDAPVSDAYDESEYDYDDYDDYDEFVEIYEEDWPI